MKKKRILFSILIVVILIAGGESCSTYSFRKNYNEVNKLRHSTENLAAKPFLKAHMKNGEVYILKDSWIISENGNEVSGSGTRYDFNRKANQEGAFSLLVDSVAIFETNTKLQGTEKERVAALAFLAGVDIILGIICLTNPKACFGSCPTFYMDENDSFHYADAEIFSEAIRPSVEYADIDALNLPCQPDGSFTLTMKNEALETHCVRDVKLLAVPREAGQKVYHCYPDQFFLCENIYPPKKASAHEGDITYLLNLPDRMERFSMADERNMKSSEEIFMNFQVPENSAQLGLLLNFRQTLMTTYLIYSAMGYMGDKVGDIFARMETGKPSGEKRSETSIQTPQSSDLKKELGKIEVFSWNEKTNHWDYQNSFYEIGPIAINQQIIPLRNLEPGDEIRLKLVVNKGLWRIDFAALTQINNQAEPVWISPDQIFNKGLTDNGALERILDPERLLISMPGSDYKFHFTLPEQNTDYDLFLYGKGYYLEWMREQWIQDKNLVKLWKMLNHPRMYLREQAREYKEYETTMEEAFWGSKIDTKTFVYHEN